MGVRPVPSCRTPVVALAHFSVARTHGASPLPLPAPTNGTLGWLGGGAGWCDLLRRCTRHHVGGLWEARESLRAWPTVVDDGGAEGGPQSGSTGKRGIAMSRWMWTPSSRPKP